MGFAATLLYLVMLLLRPQELRPEWAVFPIMDVLGWTAVACTVLSFALGDRPRPVWQQIAAGLLFLLWSALSVAAAVRWFGGAVERLLELSVSIYVLFILAANVSSRRRLAACVTVSCACLLVVLGQSIAAFYSGVEESPFFLRTAAGSGYNFLDASESGGTESGGMLSPEGDTSETVYVKRARALGFLNDPNDFAQILVSMIPLLFVAWRKGRWVLNLGIVLVPAGLVVWGVVLTRSRGGMLALCALLPLAWIIRMEARSRHAAVTALALATVPGMIVLFRYALTDESAMGRIEAWSAGLQMLKSSPVWGVGSGFFMDHHSRVAHNSFVQCFAETGLVGYFLWLSLLILSLLLMAELADAGEGWSRWARGLQLSLLGFLVAALFLSRTTSPALFLLTGLAAAAASTARSEGLDLKVHPSWPRRVALAEALSIVAVWLTARAAW